MIIINMLSRIVNVIKHPQFQKMSDYYSMGLPFALMLGGFSGTILGVSMLDKYIEYQYSYNRLIKTNISPRKGAMIILGGFCAGLMGGVFYPIVIPFSSAYFIKQTLNQLKED